MNKWQAYLRTALIVLAIILAQHYFFYFIDRKEYIFSLLPLLLFSMAMWDVSQQYENNVEADGLPKIILTFDPDQIDEEQATAIIDEITTVMRKYQK